MSQSSSLSSHPRSDQGLHGHLGGLQGNCSEAKKQGAKGSRYGKKGGEASKGSRKSGTNFKQNLLLVTMFRVHNDLANIITHCVSESLPGEPIRFFESLFMASFIPWRKLECVR